MHEFLITLLNIYIFGYIIKKFFRLNIYLSIFISFMIIWILFLNVNPYKYGSNKYSILSYMPSEHFLEMSMLNNTNINNLQYPVIFKPIRCSKTGKDVEIINNINEAAKYLENKNTNEIMVQTFIPYKNEIGILYEKNIISIVSKKSKDSDIMKSCYGNVTCEDLTRLLTPELNNKIKEISNKIPNFNVGRYDIKYKDLKTLLEGKDFYIVEVNGTMGFDLRKSNLQYFGILSIYYIERWFLYRQLQGLINIITLNGYNPIKLIQIMTKTVYNTINCMDWEKLFAIYS
jgi:hypothetical protein